MFDNEEPVADVFSVRVLVLKLKKESDCLGEIIKERVDLHPILWTGESVE